MTQFDHKVFATSIGISSCVSRLRCSARSRSTSCGEGESGRKARQENDAQDRGSLAKIEGSLAKRARKMHEDRETKYAMIQSRGVQWQNAKFAATNTTKLSS